MKKIEKSCLSCKKYRLLDVGSGLCRLKKMKRIEEYPKKSNDDLCDSWLDCGQDYYIRLGWIKKTRKNLVEVS